ncbi:MAG: hypothetical protein J0H94_04475 [Rhizobiales bacterium]|nr:hypothetical protein [Hyphomicrobiales bacterium]
MAERLEKAYRANRVAHLKPETALVVATACRAYAMVPNRDEIARMVCRGRLTSCNTICVTCLSAANLISRHLDGDPEHAKAPVYRESKWSIPTTPKEGEDKGNGVAGDSGNV